MDYASDIKGLARLLANHEITAAEYRAAYAALKDEYGIVDSDRPTDQRLPNLDFNGRPPLLKNSIDQFAAALAVFFGAHTLAAGTSFEQHVWLLDISLPLYVGFVLAVRYVFITFFNRLDVADGYVLVEKGILSKDRKEIAIEAIRSVRVKQSILQRLVGVGDIEIITAGDTPEVEFLGLEQPHALRDYVKDYQRSLRPKAARM